jgi:hypothetical protein
LSAETEWHFMQPLFFSKPSAELTSCALAVTAQNPSTAALASTVFISWFSLIDPALILRAFDAFAQRHLLIWIKGPLHGQRN